MTMITKCLNDWNATIEAMGHGEQSILLRKTSTTQKEFLLYPTVSYANNEDYLNSFKREYVDFVKEYTYPLQEDGKYEVKYYATVEKVNKVSTSRIGKYNNYHIWTKRHVSSYFDSSHANLWILRVYRLDEPLFLKRTRGMVFANVNKKVELDYKNPVIPDDEFMLLNEEILNR